MGRRILYKHYVFCQVERTHLREGRIRERRKQESKIKLRVLGGSHLKTDIIHSNRYGSGAHYNKC